LSSFAAQWTGEFAIVAVLLVSGFRSDVVLDAFLAERMQTGETLGISIRLQTDLADKKFIVDFLSKSGNCRGRCG
jgi:hypothetical protein